MSLIDNARYQPSLKPGVYGSINSVLDEVDILKERVGELENENARLYKLLDTLDERINIIANEKHSQ